MTRIPLQIKDGKLVLTCVIECRSLRIHKSIMTFVVDTGSSASFISLKDCTKMQIPVSGKSSSGEVDFGGSRFDQIRLPRFKMYALKENNSTNDYLEFNFEISALRSNKKNDAKLQVAQMLPSILGLDFLKENKIGLHVIMAEDIAYLDA